MAAVQLLYVWVSPYGLRVELALAFKGVEHEKVAQDLGNKSKLLLESNPIHKQIPVLIHDGKPICESLVIVYYIDEAWPPSSVVDGKAALLPKDPYQRAVARFWADYVDKKVYDAGMRIVKSPEGEAREQAKTDLAQCFVTLDAALLDVSGGAPYFGGDRIGLVDIALAPFIPWFQAFQTLGGFQLPDQARCPHLNAWMKVIVEYPSVKEALTLCPTDKLLEVARGFRRRSLEGA